MGPPTTASTTTTGTTTTGPTTTTGNTSTTPTTTTTTTVTTGGGGSGSGNGGGGGTGGNGEGDEDGSLFAGECGKAPICDGDAVLCAVAAATFKQECNWRPGPSVESAAFDTAKVLTGDQTGNLPGNSSVAIGPSSFDQTNILGSAFGISDRSITVMGSTINVPFSVVNVWLERLGLVLQAVTFLLCIRIVTRG